MVDLAGETEANILRLHQITSVHEVGHANTRAYSWARIWPSTSSRHSCRSYSEITKSSATIGFMPCTLISSAETQSEMPMECAMCSLVIGWWSTNPRPITVVQPILPIDKAVDGDVAAVSMVISLQRSTPDQATMTRSKGVVSINYYKYTLIAIFYLLIAERNRDIAHSLRF